MNYRRNNRKFASSPQDLDVSSNFESPMVMLPPLELREQTNQFRKYMKEQLKKQALVVTNIK